MPSSPPPLPSSDLGEADLNRSPQPQASGSTRNIVVSLLLSALVLAGVGYVTFDAGAFGRLLQHLRPELLAAAVAVAFARIGLGGWRLSQVSEGRLSLRSGTRGQLAWDFFSSVTP
ncbi:lysylphosphatidylglycerol synthase domain-containing protein [Salinibacter ruber]|uniref:lysylphosphatidylglycerol synthase domain-containing protein n=1 Tax=Salinibacter ruber TaxID=146919 RepID=UPI001F07E144|nr:lysylphosphatidylglycerol synthase domain-containing protein [Salinibacter ruber]